MRQPKRAEGPVLKSEGAAFPAPESMKTGGWSLRRQRTPQRDEVAHHSRKALMRGALRYREALYGARGIKRSEPLLRFSACAAFERQERRIGLDDGLPNLRLFAQGKARFSSHRQKRKRKKRRQHSCCRFQFKGCERAHMYNNSYQFSAIMATGYSILAGMGGIPAFALPPHKARQFQHSKADRMKVQKASAAFLQPFSCNAVCAMLPAL